MLNGYISNNIGGNVIYNKVKIKIKVKKDFIVKANTL